MWQPAAGGPVLRTWMTLWTTQALSSTVRKTVKMCSDWWAVQTRPWNGAPAHQLAPGKPPGPSQFNVRTVCIETFVKGLGLRLSRSAPARGFVRCEKIWTCSKPKYRENQRLRSSRENHYC